MARVIRLFLLVFSAVLRGSLFASASDVPADTTQAPPQLSTSCTTGLPDFCRRPGTIWCDAGAADVSLEYLAIHTAPILWFSPDEPLFERQPTTTDPGRPIPRELAFQIGKDGRATGSASSRVVYWQVDGVLMRAGNRAEIEERLTSASASLPVASLRMLKLSFFFYYDNDSGMNPHYHDLEGVEFQLATEGPYVAPDGESWRRVYIDRVTGLGHGSGLVSNLLQIQPFFRQKLGAPDVKLPVTILVEEGKHASCPDRNGDGIYTPGYDVNVRVPDAWGLRDVFGSKVIASKYQPWMSKTRNPRDRFALRPSFFTPADPFSPVDCYRTAHNLEYPKEHGYELRPVPRCRDCATLSSDRAFCEEMCPGGSPKDLRVAMARGELPGVPCKADRRDAKKCKELNMPRRVGKAFHDPEVTVSDRRLLGLDVGKMRYKYGGDWPLQSLQQSLAASARFEARSFGFGASYYLPVGLPFFAGWPAVRAGLLYEEGAWHKRVDLGYTPSIGRMADLYVAAGYDWGRQAPIERSSAADRGVAVEGGLQLRFREIGLRGGLRGSVARGHIDRVRFVAELGYGPNPERAKIH